MSEQQSTVNITEYLAINLATERWTCRVCGQDIANARENYKESK